jgi:hypothetical protein
VPDGPSIWRSARGCREFGFACSKAIQAEVGSWHRTPSRGMHKYDPAANRAIRARDRVCARDAIPERECCRALWPSEITPIRDQRCAGWSQVLSTVVSSAGSRVGTPTWMSTGGGVSTGRAAHAGGSRGETVPRTGWRFVRHLNRLSALAFLRPARKVSLEAEFPAPFNGSQSSVPGFLLRCPVRGERNDTEAAERRLGIADLPSIGC